MLNRHLEGEMLERALRGEVEPKEVIRSLLQHLLAICPQCRREWRRFALPQRAAVQSSTLSNYRAAFAKAMEVARHREADLEREKAEASELVKELVQAPELLQTVLLRDDSRFWKWGVVDVLINESQQAAFDDPAAAEALAKLAISLANRLDPGVYGEAFLADVRAVAWAYLGNARRVASDLRGAAEALDLAGDLLEDGVGDPLTRAQVLNLKASLRRAQRRFGESQQLLEEVIAIYREAGDAHMEGRTLVQQACDYLASGMAAGAVPVLRRALALIEEGWDPRLVLCARHNLIWSLLECEHFEEARMLFDETLPLYETSPSMATRLRRRWLEGRLSAGFDRSTEAEAAFRETRDGFIAQGIGYDAALVSLDLAALYAAHGRMAEVRSLAEEMLPIFRSRDVHREALAALLVFQQAARSESITVRVVEEVAAFLRRARRDPTLRYEEPS